MDKNENNEYKLAKNTNFSYGVQREDIAKRVDKEVLDKVDAKIIAVQRMQDYIESNLSSDITLADLSRVSYFSPWYSYRLFKEYTNYTPAEYIRRFRLSQSAMKLRNKESKIIDIALDLGFTSVDGYQRAFYKEFKCNPSEYAKNPVPLYLFTPFGVIYNQLWKETTDMSDVKNVFIQVIHKPKRKIILKRGKAATDYFAYCEEVGCDVWGLLTSIKSINGEPVCMWLPDEYRLPGTSEYVQGVEVPLEYYGVVPEGLDIMEFPEGDFVMFKGEPFEEEKYCEAIDEIKRAMNKYDPTICGYDWKKPGIRIQLEPVGSRGYIEMLEVVKR